MKLNVSAGTIAQLDRGMAGLLIDHQLGILARDLDQRGEDDKPRKLVIQLEFIKMKNSNLVAVDIDCKTVLPPFRAGGTVAAMHVDKKSASLSFESENPGNPDQSTIDFDQQQEGQN